MASEASSGVGFCGLLTLLFIGLKLTGHITWSWIWVLSPLWLGLLISLGILGLVLGVIGLFGLFGLFSSRKAKSQPSKFWDKVSRRR
jgi:hypothetical protein